MENVHSKYAVVVAPHPEVAARMIALEVAAMTRDEIRVVIIDDSRFAAEPMRLKRVELVELDVVRPFYFGKDPKEARSTREQYKNRSRQHSRYVK